MNSADYDLIQAVMGEDFEEAQKALENGADPNVRNEGGNSALLLAARTACPDIVELLLKAGADVDYANSGGDTALSSAKFRYEREVNEGLDEDRKSRFEKVIQMLTKAVPSKPQNEELNYLWSLVSRSLNAKKFADACSKNSFSVVREDNMGLMLKSQGGSLIVSVLASHHPENIFCLIYKDEQTGQKTCLVDEGKIQPNSKSLSGEQQRDNKKPWWRFW